MITQNILFLLAWMLLWNGAVWVRCSGFYEELNPIFIKISQFHKRIFCTIFPIAIITFFFAYDYNKLDILGLPGMFAIGFHLFAIAIMYEFIQKRCYKRTAIGEEGTQHSEESGLYNLGVHYIVVYLVIYSSYHVLWSK